MRSGQKVERYIPREGKNVFAVFADRILFFCSKLEDNAERWYSKLAATKGDWEALRMAFTAAFQMEEVLGFRCHAQLKTTPQFGMADLPSLNIAGLLDI